MAVNEFPIADRTAIVFVQRGECVRQALRFLLFLQCLQFNIAQSTVAVEVSAGEVRSAYRFDLLTGHAAVAVGVEALDEDRQSGLVV